MSLTHNGPDPDQHVAPERTLRPAAVVEAERATVKRAAGDITSPAIERAKKRVETLKTANASPQVIQRAEGKLQDAYLDHHEAQAEKLNAARQATLEGQKEVARQRIQNETLWRISDQAPVMVMRFAGITVTMFPAKSTNHTDRAFAYGDWARVSQRIATESERIAKVASLHGPLVILPVNHERFVAELRDLARRSIRAGLTSIEVS